MNQCLSFILSRSPILIISHTDCGLSLFNNVNDQIIRQNEFLLVESYYVHLLITPHRRQTTKVRAVTWRQHK